VPAVPRGALRARARASLAGTTRAAADGTRRSPCSTRLSQATALAASRPRTPPAHHPLPLTPHPALPCPALPRPTAPSPKPMEDDGPHAAPRLLALDIARMASGGVCMMADQDTPASPPPARTEALASEGSTHLSAEVRRARRGPGKAALDQRGAPATASSQEAHTGLANSLCAPHSTPPCPGPGPASRLCPSSAARCPWSAKSSCTPTACGGARGAGPRVGSPPAVGRSGNCAAPLLPLPGSGKG
jgi:hypothetical protein